MELLKLYWLPDQPLYDPPLPEGYSIVPFDPQTDVSAWCDCLRGGALIDDCKTDADAYARDI